MASRVNTKFVVILTTLVVLAVGATAGFWYLFVRADPQKLIAQADVFMQQGHIRAAVNDYQRALSQRQSDVKLILTTVNALKRMPVTDRTEAKQVFMHIRGLTRDASDLRPNNASLERQLYRQGMSYARQFDDHNFYDHIYQIADAKLHNNPKDMVARKYRGIAQVQRLNGNMSDADIAQARTDLLQVLKAEPRDAGAAYYLARWNLFQAEQIKRTQGNASRQKAYVKRATALAGQVLKGQGPVIQRRLWTARIYVNPLVDQKARARPLIAKLETTMLKKPGSPLAVLTLAALLATVDQQPSAADAAAVTMGMQRAHRVIAVAIKRDPNNPVYLLAMGRLLRQEHKLQAAIAQFEKARSVAATGTAVQVLLARGRITEAGFEEARLLLALGGGHGQPAKAAIKRAASVIADLAQTLGGDLPIVNRFQGQLALEQGDNQKAAIELGRASDQMQDKDPQLLLLSAEAYRRTGQWGAAVGQLNKLLKRVSQPTRIRAMLAGMYLRHGALDKAAQQAALVLKADPANVEGKMVAADVLGRKGKAKQAMALYRSIDASKHPAVIPAMAQIHLQLGEKAAAMALLRRGFAKAPTNLPVLRMLLALTPNPTRRRALIQQAAKAGANKQAMALLHAMMQGSAGKNLDQRVDALLSVETDPVKRALAKARFYFGQGDDKRGQVDLAKAAKLAPNDPMLVRLQFDRSLSKHQWAKARILADKAGAMNLDQAKGTFFDGRLAMARGRYDKAVASYQQGLAARPVYSEGQRRLGDALRAQGNLAQAVEAYQQAVQQRPNNVAALRGLAAVEDQQGNHQAALADLQRAVQAAPINGRLMQQYLAYEQRYGDRKLALRYREQLAKRAPKLYRNRRALAVLHAELGQDKAAIKTVKALIAEAGLTRSNLETQLAVDAILGRKQAGEQAAQAYLAKRGKNVDTMDYLMLAHYRMVVGDGKGMLKAYHQAIAVENPKTQPATRELADLLFARGRNARAEVLYQELVKNHPKEDPLKLRLAETLVRENKLDQAQKLVAPMQSSAEATALRGMIAQRRGHDALALKLFNQAIDNGGTVAAIYFERGRLLASEGKLDQAVSDLEQAVSEQPSLLPAQQLLVVLQLKRGRSGAAISELKAMLKRYPQLPQAREQLVAIYRSQKDLLPARAILAKAIKRFPKQALWPALMGQVALQDGKAHEAVEYWRQAVALAPTPNNLALLAQGLVQIGKPAHAVALLDKHSSRVNGQPILQGIKAQALAAMGKKDEAATLFSHALKRCKQNGVFQQISVRMVAALGAKTADAQLAAMEGKNAVWAALMRATLQMSRHNYPAALKDLALVRGRVSDAERQLLDRMQGQCFYQTGAYAKARQIYDRLLKKDPHDVSTMNNLAFLLADKLDKPKQALALAQRAAKARPHSFQVLDTLGWAQYKAGKLTAARRTLEQSVGIKSTANNSYHLGYVYHALGIAKRAGTLLNKAVALAKKSGNKVILDNAEQILKGSGKKHSKDR